MLWMLGALLLGVALLVGAVAGLVWLGSVLGAGWVLLAVVLVVLALGVLALLGLRVYRTARALLASVERSGAVLAEAAESLQPDPLQRESAPPAPVPARPRLTP